MGIAPRIALCRVADLRYQLLETVPAHGVAGIDQGGDVRRARRPNDRCTRALLQQGSEQFFEVQFDIFIKIVAGGENGAFGSSHVARFLWRFKGSVSIEDCRTSTGAVESEFFDP